MLGTTRQARAGRRRAGRSSAFLSSLLSHRARWLLPTPRPRCRFPSRERRIGQRLAGPADLRLRPSERRMWRRARTGHFSISERPAAVSAGVVEREELAVDVEHGNLLALHLDQTRLTRPDLSCPRWPGDQHCEITFVPVIPVSFGENERAAANSESRQGCSSRWSADR